jgi:hypothetical protein
VPYTSDINGGQFNFFMCKLKVTGSCLVATYSSEVGTVKRTLCSIFINSVLLFFN